MGGLFKGEKNSRKYHTVLYYTILLYDHIIIANNINFMYVGQTIDIPPRSYHYLTGEETRLECQVQTRFDLDTPFNPWRKGSVDIDEDDRITVTVSSTRSVLHIRNLQSSDAGEYTCSKQGFPSVSVTVTIETSPGMLTRSSINYNLKWSS